MCEVLRFSFPSTIIELDIVCLDGAAASHPEWQNGDVELCRLVLGLYGFNRLCLVLAACSGVSLRDLSPAAMLEVFMVSVFDSRVPVDIGFSSLHRSIHQIGLAYACSGCT